MTPDRHCLVDEVADEHRRRISTSELNRFFAEVCETHPPPNKGSRSVIIHYLTQPRTKPPTFLLFANHPSCIDKSYNRFIANRLRERYGFRGTPLRVLVKAKKKVRLGPKTKRRGRKGRGKGRR